MEILKYKFISENEWFLPYVEDLKDYIDIESNILDQIKYMIYEAFGLSEPQFTYPGYLYILLDKGIVISILFINDVKYEKQLLSKYDIYGYYMYTLVTSQEYLGKGYMKLLIYHVIKDLHREYGKKRMFYLEYEKSNKLLEEIYKKIGFYKIGDDDGHTIMMIV
uniref:Acetyltransferase (GNAT) family protein n=1 Tax=Pithovirus LCPAC101 TaxID=2506586 RepID=A0A481Z2X4_9VIRU|nr:MAG: acetyltransferase (GNAT) family protein [Pithovirus LCPAC101]